MLVAAEACPVSCGLSKRMVGDQVGKSASRSAPRVLQDRTRGRRAEVSVRGRDPAARTSVGRR